VTKMKMTSYVEESYIDGESELFITIPNQILNEMGWKEGDTLELELTSYGVRVTKEKNTYSLDAKYYDEICRFLKEEEETK